MRGVVSCTKKKRRNKRGVTVKPDVSAISMHSDQREDTLRYLEDAQSEIRSKVPSPPPP